MAVIPVVAQTPHFHAQDVELRFTRGSGNGGQNKNKVETCVVAKHLPTGLEVRCDAERSQHKNRALALELLAAKVEVRANALQTSTTCVARREQIGSGMRGDKVRTIRCQDRTVKCELTGRKKALEKYLEGEIEF
ncbi:MAG: hypothetical protein JSS66_07570 [Armatimonadetes bacterium]|nr:hypothetical protein [Armatimonadota bacterium]